MFIRTLTLFVFALLFQLVFLSSMAAQETRTPREVGLQFSRLDFDGGSGFSAFYKKQKKENVYRRIRFFSSNLAFASVEEDFSFNFSAGFAIGREKRKSLDSKLQFYQGPEFALQLSLASLGEDDLRFGVSPSFGWVLGLQHSFNERWAVNLETIPGVAVSADIRGESGPNTVAFNAGFNNFVSLGLLRKF